MKTPPAALQRETSTHARRWLPAGLLLAAVLLRCHRLDGLGLEHFDEGVYAISGLWPFRPPEAPAFYVNQHFYAPWLLPFLIGLSYLVLGVSDLAAIAVNLMAGSFTVAAVWWIGRRWYGPAAGAAAACVAAFSDFHVLHSRMALTDVLLTAWLVLAIGCLAEALARPSFKWAVVAGAATALAWNTKYNGWLPLGIGLLPIVPAAVAEGFTRPILWRRVGCWLVAAAVATLGYLPWFLYVQGEPWLLGIDGQPGGYGKLLEHHRGYVVGWAGWWTNLQTHAAIQQTLDGWAGRAAFPIALLAAALGIGINWRLNAWRLAIMAAGLLAAAAQTSSIGVLGVLGIVGLVLGFTQSRRDRTAPNRAKPPSSPIPWAAWIHVSWFAVLLLLTPLYHSYARLAMPWLPALWLAAGAAIGNGIVPLLPRGPDPHKGEGRDRAKTKQSLMVVAPPRRLAVWLLLIGSALALASLAVKRPRNGALTWHRTDGVRIATAAIARRVPAGSPILVYAEPPVVFYLAGRASPLGALKALDGLPPRRLQLFLVVGPQAHQDPSARQELEVQRRHLREIAVFPLNPGPAALLDAPAPGGAAGSLRKPWQLELYEVLPASPKPVDRRGREGFHR